MGHSTRVESSIRAEVSVRNVVHFEDGGVLGLGESLPPAGDGVNDWIFWSFGPFWSKLSRARTHAVQRTQSSIPGITVTRRRH